MSQDNGSNYQDELDVYQTAWVIGKQRGVEAPLEKDKLVKLLEAGRLEWSVLGEEERVMISKHRKKDFEKQGVDASRIAKMIKMVVQGLFSRIEKDFPSTDWNAMEAKQKQAVKEELFRVKYGSYRDYFSVKLAQRWM